MTLFDPHRDSRLTALAAGTLPSWRRQRALAHVRGCARCTERYERLILADRALSGSTPGEQELATLREANRRAALAAARGTPERSPLRLWAPALGAALATLIAVVVFRPAPPSEFTARGGAEDPGAALRVFCARPAGKLVELHPNDPCPPGAMLAFTVRFTQTPPSTVALEVRGGPNPEKVDLPVTSAAGKELPLQHTVELQGSGAREVVLTAGDTVLRQSLRVEPDR